MMFDIKKIKIIQVLKNSGNKQDFDWKKIERSVYLAGKDTKAYSKKEAEKILNEVAIKLSQVSGKILKTQEIRDLVEPAMASAGYFQTAKYYILFHERKTKKKSLIDPLLTDLGRQIAEKRYLRSDMNGKIIESVGEMMWRVARHMAKAEITWSSNGEYEEIAKEFYERMVNWKFVCAGKAMFEAGNPGGTGQLSSCFVLPINDSIDSIFNTLGQAAVVHKNNGGTGFNFSKIRPHGDKVKNVPGSASGPVDFLKAYSSSLGHILQGSKRQGANIAVLNVDHPDIFDFIYLKDQDGTIKNFNISVGVTDKFMQAVVEDKDWELINPRNGEIWKKLKAKFLFDEIVKHAWMTGDPGLAFLDRLEEDNPTPSLGKLEATNPCGEIPLLPYESCNLTSICLHNHLIQKISDSGEVEYEIDWDDLAKSVRLGIRFLDNMIEVNTYALKEIEQMVKYGNRRIGLGVMGFAHLLYKMGIPYNSSKAVRLSSQLAKFIHQNAEQASLELAKIRGVFPNFDISIYAGTAERYRNCALTMIAPTGTISLLANTSSGIEPVFSLVTLRRAFNEDNKDNRPSKEFMIVDPIFEDELAKLDFKKTKFIVKNTNEPLNTIDDVLFAVASYGLEAIEGLPSWFYKVFVTTHGIEPKWHVEIQAAWQKWFDNSISKTVNFPHEASVDDVREVYLSAWKLGCKGVTIYRDGSKQDQVLNLAKDVKKQNIASGDKSLSHDSDKKEMSNNESVYIKPSTGEVHMCPECGAAAQFVDGCVMCGECGWSKCVL